MNKRKLLFAIFLLILIATAVTYTSYNNNKIKEYKIVIKGEIDENNYEIKGKPGKGKDTVLYNMLNRVRKNENNKEMFDIFYQYENAEDILKKKEFSTYENINFEITGRELNIKTIGKYWKKFRMEVWIDNVLIYTDEAKGSGMIEYVDK